MTSVNCLQTRFDGASQLYIYSTQDYLFSYDQSVFQSGFPSPTLREV